MNFVTFQNTSSDHSKMTKNFTVYVKNHEKFDFFVRKYENSKKSTFFCSGIIKCIQRCHFRTAADKQILRKDYESSAKSSKTNRLLYSPGEKQGSNSDFNLKI